MNLCVNQFSFQKIEGRSLFRGLGAYSRGRLLDIPVSRLGAYSRGALIRGGAYSRGRLLEALRC